MASRYAAPDALDDEPRAFEIVGLVLIALVLAGLLWLASVL